MNIKFNVTDVDCSEIHEIPNAWSDDEYRNFLEFADFDDWKNIDASELKDYVIMVLQDSEPDEAAELLLKYKFEDQFKAGYLQSMSHEMMEEKLWEEYKDINLHATLYNCAVIAKWAFPRKFPETDAIQIKLTITSNDANIVWTKPLIARLLAKGMDSHAIINRLFDEQLEKPSFPEAEGIIWSFEVQKEDNTYTLLVYSSTYWLRDMDNVSSYETTFNADLIKPKTL